MNAILNLWKNKKNRNWGIALVAVTAVILAGFGFSSANTVSVTANTEAKVVSLDVAETIEASGTLEAQPFASLNWKTSGIVEVVNVKPGDFVKAGDVLLTLQPESTSANIASAQADLIDAQKNLEDGMNSDSELAQAIIDLEDAQDELDDKGRYLKYLQTNKRVPLTDTFGWYEQGRTGWTYVSKTREYRGPATKEMITTAENNLELARANLEDIQREVDRLKNKEQDILAYQAKVDAALATVNSMSIIAPFDGQILSVDHHTGDTVNTGELSVNLADMDHLYVETQVDESDIADIKLGNQAEVTLDAVSGMTFTGKVTTINPVGEVVSGLVKYKVRVDLDKVDTKDFLPLGTTANVVIKTKDASATLAVPIAAIQNDTNGEYVWVIQADGSNARVDVVSGSIIGDVVAVTGKLKDGDRLQLVNNGGFEAPNPLQGGE